MPPAAFRGWECWVIESKAEKRKGFLSKSNHQNIKSSALFIFSKEDRAFAFESDSSLRNPQVESSCASVPLSFVFGDARTQSCNRFRSPFKSKSNHNRIDEELKSNRIDGSVVPIHLETDYDDLIPIVWIRFWTSKKKIKIKNLNIRTYPFNN